MTSRTTTRSAQETMQVGMSLARELQRGDFIAIHGELGAGKTQLVKGIARGLGVSESVTSPTFVILNRYSGRDRKSRELFLYHFDFYRIRTLSEIYDVGFEEFARGESICVVEWPEALGPLLPERRYDILIEFGPASNERRMVIDGPAREPLAGAPASGRAVRK